MNSIEISPTALMEKLSKDKKLQLGTGIIILLGIIMLTSCNFQVSDNGYASTGTSDEVVQIADTQFPAAETPPAPTSPPEPVSVGLEEVITSDSCFDLDEGVSLPIGHDDCDFSFELVGESGSKNIRFEPHTKASFVFEAVFWEAPSLEQCQDHGVYSPATQVITTEQSYFVCYQTNKGYLGYLFIRSYDWPELTVDWHTYDAQPGFFSGELAAVQTETQAPVSARTHRKEENIWMKIFEGIDLDMGRIDNILVPGLDFRVLPGTYSIEGVLQTIVIQPGLAVGYDLSLPFTEPPNYEECLNASDYISAPIKLDISRKYICFQTDRGRIGYLHFHEINPAWGVRIDFLTWAGTEEAKIAASPVPTLSGGVANQAELLSESALSVNTYRPKERFNHTWQVGNIGDNTWSSSFSIIFTNGHQMSGVTKQLFRVSTKPGDILKITLNLVAPDEQGTYVGEYWLEDTAGNRFGIGPHFDQPLVVVINVGEPGLTLAEGEQVELEDGQCFDLDLGYSSVNDPACDFSVKSALDSGSVLFIGNQGAFNFARVLTVPPRLGECQETRLSSGDILLDLQNWYVCYRTDQGHFGWLYLHETGDGGLLFDWKTYQ